MSIYTRKGDAGGTRLFSGERIAKDDLRVDTYGTLDELQAQLGMARSLFVDDEFSDLVYRIQQDISSACAQLASSPEKRAQLKRKVGREEAAMLEHEIDRLVATYALPNGFIVPGRAPDSAAVHVSRTVCRRGERLLVKLNRELPGFDDLLVYFNRLSDFLFTLAWALEVRHVARTAVTEVVLEGSR